MSDKKILEAFAASWSPSNMRGPTPEEYRALWRLEHSVYQAQDADIERGLVPLEHHTAIKAELIDNEYTAMNGYNQTPNERAYSEFVANRAEQARQRYFGGVR